MSKRPTPEPPKTSNVAQIVVATIGALAVLGAALFANWEKLVPRKTSESMAPNPSPSSSGAAQSTSQQSTQGQQSPNISGVGGNVTIYTGASSAEATTGRSGPIANASPVAGEWQARITDSDGEFLGGFDLNVEGEAVSGYATFRQESALRDGRLHGRELQFVTQGTGPNGDPELRRYRGVLTRNEIYNRNEIRFTMDIESSDKQHRAIVFTATR